VDLVDEENRARPRHQRADDGLEALLEVAAEARAGEERARVEREHLGAGEHVRHVVVEQPCRQAFGHCGFADASLADEHGIVLPPAAEHLDGPLQLLRPADQRIEQALPGAIGEIQTVRRKRIARGRRPFFAGPGFRLAAAAPRRRLLAGRRRLAHAVRDEVEHVEPRDVLRFEQPGRVRLRLLQDRRQDVPGVDLGALGALDVEHGRLEDAPERRGLFRLALVPAPQLLDRRVEVLVELAAQPRQVGAAGGQDALAFTVVRQRVQQMLEREVGVTARHRFAVGDRQDDFDRR
jgi:hypothetical protein